MIEQLKTIRYLMDTYCPECHDGYAALTQLEAMAGEPARPDIIEKLTYHARERDDMTMDDCLSYLNTNGWHKVRGRTERELILQITALLAAAPVAQQPRQINALSIDSPITVGGCPFCGRQSCVAGQCQREPVAQQPHECTRSHPHENMDGFCLLRTEIARLTNENARLKAQQPQAGQVEGVAPSSDHVPAHAPWCASLNMMLTSNPPKPAPCNCKPHHKTAPQQAEAVPSDVVRDADLALDLLSKLFNAYENGLACYEDPDEQAGYVGNAVELDADTIHACADLLNRRRPIAAIAQQKGQP